MAGVKLFASQLVQVRTGISKPTAATAKAIQYGAKLVDHGHEWKVGAAVLYFEYHGTAPPIAGTIRSVIAPMAEWAPLRYIVITNKGQSIAVPRHLLFLAP